MDHLQSSMTSPLLGVETPVENWDVESPPTKHDDIIGTLQGSTATADTTTSIKIAECRQRLRSDDPQSTADNKIEKATDDAPCCDSENCKDNLANGNFFLPAGCAGIRRLNFVVKRGSTLSTDFLEGDDEEQGGGNQCCDDENCNGDRLANANFFLPVTKRFDPEDAAAVEEEDAAVVEEEEGEEPISSIGRSHITAKGICCASEIPMVQSILLPIKGVVTVKVSPATKAIYVDHSNIVSASELCHALDEGGFTSTLVTDASVKITQQIGIPMDVTVDSIFDIIIPGGKAGTEDSLKEEDVSTALTSSLGEEGIMKVSLGVDGKSLTVEHNPYYVTASQIVHSLNNIIEGYTIKISSDGGEGGRWAIKEGNSESIETQRSTVGVHVILSGVLCAISFLGYIPGGNWHYLKYVALGSVALGLPSIGIKAYHTLRRCKFDVNCLTLFAVIGACALQDFVEAAVLTFLFDISEWLEAIAMTRATNALSSIVSIRPDEANLINPITKEIVILSASTVKVGSTVSVRTGDKIPCDGVVIEGESTVDESNLTGESRPVKKVPGDLVSGGTINNGSTQLIIKTTATTSNSAVAKLLRIVEEAQSNRSKTEAMVDSVAKIYTPVVVLAAICMCTFPFIVSKEVGKAWLYKGLILFVVACPCALIISTPVTYVAGLAACAQKGIIVKGGQHLETLAMTKYIAFDKTGVSYKS